MTMTMAGKLRRAALAAALFLFSTACSDDPLGSGSPEPGPALLSMSAPGLEGAVLLTVTGPGIRGAQPVSTTQQVFWRLVSSNELRAVVVGDVVEGPLLMVEVFDLRRLGDYEGAVLEVADREGALREELSLYAVAFQRADGR